MLEPRNSASSASWRSYLLCYVLFAALIGLAYVVMFVVWQPTLLVLVGAVTTRSYSVRVLYMLGLLLLGGALFIFLLAAEPYLRRGAERGLLIPRFARLFIPLGLLGALGLLIQMFVTP